MNGEQDGLRGPLSSETTHAKCLLLYLKWVELSSPEKIDPSSNPWYQLV